MRRLSCLLAAAALAGLGARAASAADCTGTSTGLVPVSELGAGVYMGETGGLYGAGENAPPAGHWQAALRVGRELIRPRDFAGARAPGGRLVLLSVGMSNTTQEYQAFIDLAATRPELATSLVLVDGAQGGRDADDWSDPASDVWSEVDLRLAAAGVGPMQVQAVWLKQALAGPAVLGAFPAHASVLSDHLAGIARVLHDRYPNIGIVYLSSRIYAGYASTALNPEPYAYESAFAPRWIIDRQLGGDPLLNPDPALGPVEAPWLLWGPYLWADGLTPRADGLVWECADFAADGTHPAPAGRARVAELLLAFLEADLSARPWFLEPVALRLVKAADGYPQLQWSGATPLYQLEGSADPRAAWAAIEPSLDASEHTDREPRPSGLFLYRVW